MKRAFRIAGIVAIVLAAGFAPGCGNPVTHKGSSRVLPADAAGRMERFHYTRTTAGKTEFVLDADVAELFHDKSQAVFDNGVLRFFTKEGRMLTLTGETGTFHGDTNDIDVQGNVIARSEDGYRCLTNTLHYDAEANQVKTDDPVLFFGDQINLRGKGMTIDVDSQHLTLGGPVEALLWNLPAEGTPAGEAKVRD